MQNKTTHLTRVRTAIIKKSANSKCWREGALLHCWWECELVQRPWEPAPVAPSKLKLGLPYDPAIRSRGHTWRQPTFKNICEPQRPLQNYLQYPGHGSTLNVRQQRNG